MIVLGMRAGTGSTGRRRKNARASSADMAAARKAIDA